MRKNHRLLTFVIPAFIYVIPAKAGIYLDSYFRRNNKHRFNFVLFLVLFVIGFSIINLEPVYAQIFTRGDGKLCFYNTHTNEKLIAYYRFGEDYDNTGLKKINRVLRCYYTGKIVPISLNLLELVDAVQDHFGDDKTLQIISGYRSPTYNEIRRRQSRGVAKHSLHMRGMAMDFFIPGVSLAKVRNYAWQLQEGGVGYYPQSHNGFVHLDVGRVRSWPSRFARAGKAKSSG
jgi:uncharacterized protein YcbK (DUF882 family)